MVDSGSNASTKTNSISGFHSAMLFTPYAGVSNFTHTSFTDSVSNNIVRNSI
jgi:hypothetical protein